MRNALIAAALIASTAAVAQSPSVFVGEQYTILRQNLWQAGYRPILPRDRTGCNLSDLRCSNFPEMEVCNTDGSKLCLTRWRSPDYLSTVYIATVGTVPVVQIVRVRD